MADSQSRIVAYETGPRTVVVGRSLRTDDGARVVLRFDRTATADHPARLTGWLENATDFENTVRVDDLPGLNGVAGRTRDGDSAASVYLVPTETNRLATSSPSMERHGSGYWQVTDRGSWVPDTRRLAAGERVRLAYAPVLGPDTSTFPTGIFEFDGDDRILPLRVWNTDRPGPTGESRFAGRSVSPPGASETTWFHRADTETRAFLRPETERLTLDGTVAFEMVNHSQERLQCGHWDLHKLVDGEWFHVWPTHHFSYCAVLGPGGVESWSLRAFNGEAVPCDCEDGWTRGHLGGGTYAVVAGYGYPEGNSAALVELVGEQVTLATTPDAAVERDGETVVVTTARYGDGEGSSDATMVLEPTGAAEHRLIAEQLMGPTSGAISLRAIRNALAAVAEGVSTVTVRTDEDAVDAALGHDTESRRFRYRGAAYEVRRG